MLINFSLLFEATRMATSGSQCKPGSVDYPIKANPHQYHGCTGHYFLEGGRQLARLYRKSPNFCLVVKKCMLKLTFLQFIFQVICLSNQLFAL